MASHEVPALGRPVALGMLYDSCRDRIIPGISVLENETLKKVDKISMPSSKLEIFQEDTFQIKTSQLEIGNDLKLSIFGDLIRPAGAAKYLHYRKSSKQKVRVTLRQSVTTHWDKLMPIKKLDRPHLLEKVEATHVVIGILYGFDAFYVFDRYITSCETLQDVSGNVEVCVSAIPFLSKSDEHSTGNTRLRTSETKKITCKFYGDITPRSIPCTYEDAVSVCREFDSLKTEQSVPTRITLLPLSLLYPFRVVYPIRDNVTIKIEKILEDLYDIEIRCMDLEQKNNFSTFLFLEQSISQFKHLLNEFRAHLVSKLSRIIPEARKTANEIELEELIEYVHNSPFNFKELKHFIDLKKEELRILDTVLKTIQEEPKVQLALSSNSYKFEQLIHSTNYSYVLQFAFNIIKDEAPFIKKMRAFLSTGMVLSDSSKEWFQEEKNVIILKEKIKLFQDFVTANSARENFAFFVSNKSTTVSDTPTITLFANGEPTDFDLPPTPKPPKLTIGENAVELDWSKSEEYPGKLLFYKVYYRASGSCDWHTHSTIESRKKIQNLTKNTEYSFSVQGVFTHYNSPRSSETTARTTARTTTASSTTLDWLPNWY